MNLKGIASMCAHVASTDTQRHYYPYYSVKAAASTGLRSTDKIQGQIRFKTEYRTRGRHNTVGFGVKQSWLEPFVRLLFKATTETQFRY